MIDYFLKQLSLTDFEYEKIVENSFGSEVFKLYKDDRVLIGKIPFASNKFYREFYNYKLLQSSGISPKLISSVSPQQGNTGFLLIEYIPHTPWDYRDPSKFGEAGKLLAQLHSFSCEGLGDYNEDGFYLSNFDSWIEFRKDLTLNKWATTINPYIEKSKFEQIIAYLESIQNNLWTQKVELVNSHYDFRLGNILHTPHGPKLIDFESARSFSSFSELSSIISKSCFI